MTTPDDRLFYTKQEAAHLLSCSVRTIERMIEDGRLTAARVAGADLRVSRASFASMIETALAKGASK